MFDMSSEDLERFARRISDLTRLSLEEAGELAATLDVREVEDGMLVLRGASGLEVARIPEDALDD